MTENYPSINNIYVFVEYELYGMKKNILFACLSQYGNWEWALNQLNNEDDEAFKVLSIRQERW